jgi:uncharacterized lipoprotein NlpE involved in copper resistance
MNKIYSSIILLALAACGGQKAEPNAAATATGQPSTGNAYADVAGVYQDTLPCADCLGTITELTLHPDSTFLLRERMLNAEGRPAKSMNTRGVFSFVDGSSKIKLTSSEAGAVARTFEVTADGLLASEVQAQSGTDVTLDIRERIVGKVSGEFISYRLSDKGTYPSVVYMNMPGSDIVINKPALDRMKESEKAVLAYYAAQYNTGCDGARCALEEAMGTDKAALEALARKWMPSVALPSTDAMRESRVKTKLVFVNINLQQNRLTVNYSTENTDYAMAQGTDVFEISENEVKLAQKGDIKEQKRQAPPTKDGATERK